MFTRSIYKFDSPTKDGKGVIKFVKEPNLEKYTVITQTQMRITPKIPLPGRDIVIHSTRTIQTFHNKESGLTEYNRQQARLEHNGWERKLPNGRNRKESVRS